MSKINVVCKFVADDFEVSVPEKLLSDRNKLRDYVLDKFYEYGQDAEVIYEVFVDGKSVGDNRRILMVSREE